MRVAQHPKVKRTEKYLVGFGAMRTRGRTELCYIIGMNAGEDSIGMIKDLSCDMRDALTGPGAIVIDEWELDNLGLSGDVGEMIEINQKRVRVVGIVHGFHGHNFVYIFCSLRTARSLLQSQLDSSYTMGIVAKMPSPPRC